MINLDKVYTNSNGLRIIKKALNETLDLSFYSSIIDPCAGRGEFKSILPITKQYDIYPENKDIIKSDFFDINLEFSYKRIIICSPPFGDDKGKKFLNHASKMAYCIASIISKDIEPDIFIDGFKLIKTVKFKDKCFNKNGIDIKLNHYFCIWIKKNDYI